MVMSGGSRGIGLSIAVEVARGGGQVVLLAKTDTPDPRLPGTIHSAVAEIKAVGGAGVPVVGDVRNDEDVARAVATAMDLFGGIDIVVNNASVLGLSPTGQVRMKRFDLMQQVNVRGTFALTQAALPALRRSSRAHILTLSPPLNLAPTWMGAHPAYTVAKDGISSNALWPQSTIATAAVANVLGGDESVRHSRSSQIMADAAMRIQSTQPGELTGRCLLDTEVLAWQGSTDLRPYGGEEPIATDIFVDA